MNCAMNVCSLSGVIYFYTTQTRKLPNPTPVFVALISMRMCLLVYTYFYVLHQGDANNLQRLLNFEAPRMDINPQELRKIRHRDFNFRVIYS